MPTGHESRIKKDDGVGGGRAVTVPHTGLVFQLISIFTGYKQTREKGHEHPTVVHRRHSASPPPSAASPQPASGPTAAGPPPAPSPLFLTKCCELKLTSHWLWQGRFSFPRANLEPATGWAAGKTIPDAIPPCPNGNSPHACIVPTKYQSTKSASVTSFHFETSLKLCYFSNDARYSLFLNVNTARKCYPNRAAVNPKWDVMFYLIKNATFFFLLKLELNQSLKCHILR